MDVSNLGSKQVDCWLSRLYPVRFGEFLHAKTGLIYSRRSSNGLFFLPSATGSFIPRLGRQVVSHVTPGLASFCTPKQVYLVQSNRSTDCFAFLWRLTLPFLDFNGRLSPVKTRFGEFPHAKTGLSSPWRLSNAFFLMGSFLLSLQRLIIQRSTGFLTSPVPFPRHLFLRFRSASLLYNLVAICGGILPYVLALPYISLFS